VKIIPEPSALRYTAFKVIRSDIEIAITPPRIDRLRSNLAQISSRVRYIQKNVSSFLRQEFGNHKF